MMKLNSAYLKEFVHEQKCLPYFLHKKLQNVRQKYHGFDFSLYFYKDIFIEEILGTPSVTCAWEGDYEIHILTSRHDWLEAMWCLKTLYFYSELSPRLVIHEDGTLSESDIQVLKDHFINCRVIRRKEADKDINEYLKNHESCRYLRFHGEDSFKRIKMFDFYRYAQANNILVLDSDVLFFQKPEEISKRIKQNNYFYMRDYQNAYTFPIEDIKHAFHIDMKEQFNGGLVYVPIQIQDLDLIEAFLKKCMTKDCYQWSEQTVRGLLFSKYCAKHQPLSDEYQISDQPINERSIAHHFVNDGTRDGFYRKGLRHLKATKFLEQCSQGNGVV